MCVVTVLRLMNIASAISLLDRASGEKCNISSSRNGETKGRRMSPTGVDADYFGKYERLIDSFG